MTPESKEEVTKRVALQLQIALTAWHELYPDDTDEDACNKSADLIEFELEDMMTRPDVAAAAAVAAAPVTPPGESSDEDLDRLLISLGEPDEPNDVRPPQQERGSVPFRQMLIEIARAYPKGFDITTAVRDAEAQGFTHPTPRNLVSVTASGLVRGGILVRRDRGTYALSAAFLGVSDDEGN